MPEKKYNVKPTHTGSFKHKLKNKQILTPPLAP